MASKPRVVKAGDVARPSPRVDYLEDEITSRDLFGVVRGGCMVAGCDCILYRKRTRDYTVQPDEVGRLHPHNDPGITRCSCCGHTPEDHAVDEAADAKARGNDCFALGQYDGAIAHYSRSIDMRPGDETVFSNRAAAFLAKGMDAEALHDATRAVEMP